MWQGNSWARPATIDANGEGPVKRAPLEGRMFDIASQNACLSGLGRGAVDEAGSRDGFLGSVNRDNTDRRLTTDTAWMACPVPQPISGSCSPDRGARSALAAMMRGEILDPARVFFIVVRRPQWSSRASGVRAHDGRGRRPTPVLSKRPPLRERAQESRHHVGSPR